MIFQGSISRLGLSVLFILFLGAPIYASDDIFDFFDADTDLKQEVLCNADINPADVLGFLLDLNAVCILQQDFYLHTNELNQRSLLDYGLFLPDKFYCSPWQIGAHLFYNQTTRDNYTRTSTKLCSYLAIFQETLLQEIEQQLVDLDIDLNLRDVVPLFANLTVQERRMGFMMHGMRRYGPYRFRFWFPLYYNEANFFLTNEELDTIATELGITDPADDMKFARRHLIADTFGFGDLRLNFDFPFTRSGALSTKLGILATIPTAFALKNGLYGSHFCKLTRGPLVDFCKLIELFRARDATALEQFGEQFAFAALDQFAANLIDTPLGNGGHFGLGVYMRSKNKLSSIIKRPWAEYISMRSRISIEYLFPKTQRRYFIEACDQLRFAALGLDRPTQEIVDQARNDPSYARLVLGFLEQQLTDRIFPFALDTKVRPGIVFRWTTKYLYDAPRWGYYVGTDTWLTSKEKLSDIYIPPGFPRLLNTKIAQKPFGYQVGVLGGIFWKLDRNWQVSINGEYNFASTGIGRDYLLSFNFEHMF